MPQSEFASELRALGFARSQGAVSTSGFEEEKGRLINARRTAAEPASLRFDQQLRAFGFLFLAIAVGGFFSIIFYTSSKFEFRTDYPIGLLLPIANVAIAGFVAYQVLQKRLLPNLFYLAVPTIIASSYVALVEMSYELIPEGIANIGLLIQLFATVGVFVIYGMNWRSFGWQLNFEKSVANYLCIAGSFFLVIFVFVDAWTVDGLRSTYGVGSYWNAENLFLLLANLFIVISLLAQMFLTLSLNYLQKAFISAGTVLVAVGLWIGFFESALDGEYRTNGFIVIYLLGVGLTIASGVMNFLNFQSGESPMPETPKRMSFGGMRSADLLIEVDQLLYEGLLSENEAQEQKTLILSVQQSGLQFRPAGTYLSVPSMPLPPPIPVNTPVDERPLANSEFHYCGDCGSQVANSAKFCGSCGFAQD